MPGAADVAFYTGAPAAPAPSASQDVPVFGFERLEGAWQRVHERERTIGGRRQSLRVQHEAFRQWLVESIPDQVADLRTVMDRWRPDVIVTDASMWGPSLVLHEAAPIPVALAAPLIYALVPGPDAPPPGSRIARPRTAVQRARARAASRVTDLVARASGGGSTSSGPATGSARWASRSTRSAAGCRCTWSPASPSSTSPVATCPPSVRYVGPLQWHPPEPADTVAWLGSLPASRPWVHVTEGTSHYQDPFVLRAAAAGLAGAPVEAILTTGRDRDPAALGLPTAPNVHVTEWLSHDELLPRCAAW